LRDEDLRAEDLRVEDAERFEVERDDADRDDDFRLLAPRALPRALDAEREVPEREDDRDDLRADEPERRAPPDFDRDRLPERPPLRDLPRDDFRVAIGAPLGGECTTALRKIRARLRARTRARTAMMVRDAASCIMLRNDATGNAPDIACAPRMTRHTARRTHRSCVPAAPRILQSNEQNATWITLGTACERRCATVAWSTLMTPRTLRAPIRFP
jgi:hypothetical protein